MQSITSKNTSINSRKLPAIYNRIKWERIIKEWRKSHSRLYHPKVLDIGCGRYTQHIEDFLWKQGFDYLGYDPYWKTETENTWAKKWCPNIIVCSNVLNVIEDWETYKELQNFIRSYGVPYYITVYNGDNSCIGRVTKRDCYQRNEPLSHYIFNIDDVICNRTITSTEGLRYLKRT